MNWALAITCNRDALRDVIATLFVMLGLVDGKAGVERIHRSLYHAVLRLLYPAESAVRRLIVIAARGLVAELTPSGSTPPGRSKPTWARKRKGGKRQLAFQLFDQRKRFDVVCCSEGEPDAEPQVAGQRPAPKLQAAPSSDGSVATRRLRERLQVLKHALEDLPGQAKRLVRWRVRRERMASPKFRLPLRPGPAPGQRKKPVYEVDQVLLQCHELTWVRSSLIHRKVGSTQHIASNSAKPGRAVRQRGTAISAFNNDSSVHGIICKRIGVAF